jgi:hypothetical protein
MAFNCALLAVIFVAAVFVTAGGVVGVVVAEKLKLSIAYP